MFCAAKKNPSSQTLLLPNGAFRPTENPNQQDQIDVECCSKDHDRNLDLLDFASFVRQNCTRRETEMGPTTKLSAELVARGVDVWKEEDGALTQNNAGTVALRDSFFSSSVCLPLASTSHFVEASVKEAKIVLTTGRNEELRSVCAICGSFFFV
jgi:hypothetical protein